MIAPISDQSITIGRNATFLCNVTDGDDGTIMYSWERDAVSLSDDARITGNETDTLTIVNVTDSDEGMYTCIATNGGGDNTSSNPAMLTIRKSQYSTSTVVPTYNLMQTQVRWKYFMTNIQLYTITCCRVKLLGVFTIT